MNKTKLRMALKAVLRKDSGAALVHLEESGYYIPRAKAALEESRRQLVVAQQFIKEQLGE